MLRGASDIEGSSGPEGPPEGGNSDADPDWLAGTRGTPETMCHV